MDVEIFFLIFKGKHRIANFLFCQIKAIFKITYYHFIEGSTFSYKGIISLKNIKYIWLWEN